MSTSVGHIWWNGVGIDVITAIVCLNVQQYDGEVNKNMKD